LGLFVNVRGTWPEDRRLRKFGAGSQKKATASFAAPALSGQVAGRVDGPGLKAESCRSPVRRVETRRFYRRRAAHWDPTQAKSGLELATENPTSANGGQMWGTRYFTSANDGQMWGTQNPTSANCGQMWGTRYFPPQAKRGLEWALPHSSQKRACMGHPSVPQKGRSVAGWFF